MHLRRAPQRPELRPFVKELWFSDEPAVPANAAADRELALPTGDTHLVFRISGGPITMFRDSLDRSGVTAGLAAVGGARASFYVKDICAVSSTVGAVLRPGAALPLFGAHAGELAGRHTPLDDLWPTGASSAWDQLAAESDPERRLDLLESMLKARLPDVRGIHPAIAMALEAFQVPTPVREVVRTSGYSHRHFVEIFQQTVGLNPKTYCRLRRFGDALERMRVTETSIAELALDTGYSDQAHLCRDFRDFAGLTPGEYIEIAPRFAYHVSVSARLAVNSSA
jgi:AraC-like DNA-binding protein